MGLYIIRRTRQRDATVPHRTIQLGPVRPRGHPKEASKERDGRYQTHDSSLPQLHQTAALGLERTEVLAVRFEAVVPLKKRVSRGRSGQTEYANALGRERESLGEARPAGSARLFFFATELSTLR